MADKTLTFVCDVGPDDWSALPKLFGAGDEVRRFHGHTYGLDRDDAQYAGRETIPCYLPEQDGTTFFTVPVEYLKDAHGNTPSGDYMTPEKFKKIRETLGGRE